MLTDESINDIKNKIVENIHPDKIYLFGSYANGTATEESDLDLAIIYDKYDEEIKDISYKVNLLLYPRDYSLDVMVKSSESIEMSKDLSFWKNIINNGRLLYERA